MTAVLSLGVSTAGAATPWVAVSPSTGLAGGSYVSLRAGGLAPGQTVNVIQCDNLPSDPSLGCPAARTATADGQGRVAVRVKLKDPLISRTEVGSGTPVYCRADSCRLYLAWVGDDGVQEGVGSQPLRFTGSPATIKVAPSTNLRQDQWVAVTGTAFGAEGHTVKIREHVCYDIVQDTNCYGDLPYNWAKVKANGTFRTVLHVYRFVPASDYPDGRVDCNGGQELLGDCQVSVVVLNSKGQADNSFGYAETFGDPAANLTFAD
jgi:hypothetical protein